MSSQRKVEHMQIALGRADVVDRDKGYFDEIRLRHRALPEIALADVDPSVEFLGRKLSFPFLISGMTGGTNEEILKVNRNLAKAAQHCGVAMCVGSQRVMFSDSAARSSFELREFAPDVPLLGNLGAVQLNLGFGIKECREAVDVLDADGLYLHLNPLQEVVQPEGDTDFSGLGRRIGDLVEDLECPLLIKEVGAGLSVEDVMALRRYGIKYVDVAGAGGTSWSRIEHHRERQKSKLGLLFQDWGIPTPQAIRELADAGTGAKVIASGGLRTGVDLAKALALGATMGGMARPLLSPALESAEAVIACIEEIRAEYVTALFLLGQKTSEDLIGRRSVLA